MKQTKEMLVVLARQAGLLVGCGKSTSNAPSNPSAKKQQYVFALIAKNQGNPVFQAARTGAEDAARDLSAKLGTTIKVQWQTPNEDDAQKQVEFLEQMVVQGVDGISISCVIADMLTPAIDKAVQQGVAVMCFDSDAPRSKRFAFYGTDDVGAGRLIMSELAKDLGPGKHVVGIPGGNQNAANIQNRIKGALEEAKKYPDITTKGPFYSKETPQDAAAKMEEVQTANPDIDGWAMIGSWALFTDALLKWEPGKVKIVAMDALPAELPYLRKGVVSRLYAQQTYQWGYRSIEILADKVILKKDPAVPVEYSPLPRVDKSNVEQIEQDWKKMAQAMTGVVFDVRELTVHDGPGIRTTVFLNGCPLRCAWCHNPEGLSPNPQRMRSVSGERTVGAIYNSVELASVLNQQGPLLRERGGVTFSGGEALMQAAFVAETIERLEGLHVTLGTSGYASEEDFRLVAAKCDLVLFDLKLMDAEAHRRWTGMDNEPILRNLAALAEMATAFIIRVPLVPGVTDTKENLSEIASYVSALPRRPTVELLPYNRAAGGKYAACGWNGVQHLMRLLRRIFDWNFFKN